jgi:hypothetical protein
MVPTPIVIDGFICSLWPLGPLCADLLPRLVVCDHVRRGSRSYYKATELVSGILASRGKGICTLGP